MKKRTTDEWHALFADHKSSGLSAAAFCRKHGLCPKYFSLRRRQLGGHNGSASEGAFVPVSMSAPANGVMIEIKLDRDLLLRIPAAVSPQWLGALLQQLKG